MSVAKRLKDYLDQNNVKYIHMSHSPAYTAQEIAAVMHVPGKELAKTVIVKADEGFVMAVLPASRKVNLELLRNAIGAKSIKLADEKEFAALFPDCDVGGMPPFGNLYNIPVYVASDLTEDKEIVFNAGTHTDVIRMSYSDFERLVKPKVANFDEPV
ncbi:MAG: YbaK/EbsC family protein [Candidatus Caldarchaeum sp.]